MTDTAARLAALDREDIVVPWEIEEPPAPDPMRTLEEGEVDRIREAFYSKPWEDPTRYQDGFRILFVAMAGIAERGESSHDATQALRRVLARVLHGEEQAEVNRHG